MSSKVESFKDIIEKQKNFLESLYKEYYGISKDESADISKERVCEFCSNSSIN